MEHQKRRRIVAFHVWNVHGLTQNNMINDYKLHNITINVNRTDILTLTETFLSDKIDDTILQSFFPNHIIFRSDRKTSIGKQIKVEFLQQC